MDDRTIKLLDQIMKELYGSYEEAKEEHPDYHILEDLSNKVKKVRNTRKPTKNKTRIGNFSLKDLNKKENNS